MKKDLIVYIVATLLIISFGTNIFFEEPIFFNPQELDCGQGMSIPTGNDHEQQGSGQTPEDAREDCAANLKAEIENANYIDCPGCPEGQLGCEENYDDTPLIYFNGWQHNLDLSALNGPVIHFTARVSCKLAEGYVSAECTVCTGCGNGVIDAGEQCEPSGNAASGNPACPFTGNGFGTCKADCTCSNAIECTGGGDKNNCDITRNNNEDTENPVNSQNSQDF